MGPPFPRQAPNSRHRREGDTSDGSRSGSRSAGGHETVGALLMVIPPSGGADRGGRPGQPPERVPEVLVVRSDGYVMS
jgi:hypothetical protein